MSELDGWLRVATRGLAPDSVARVRGEIGEHYELAQEAAVAGGLAGADAEREALRALGDAKTANCQYRRVLLTAAEARLLCEGDWEARAICSRPWLRWLLIATPIALAEAAAVLYFSRKSGSGARCSASGAGDDYSFLGNAAADQHSAARTMVPVRKMAGDDCGGYLAVRAGDATVVVAPALLLLASRAY